VTKPKPLDIAAEVASWQPDTTTSVSARRRPRRVQVGTGGWAKLSVESGELPPARRGDGETGVEVSPASHRTLRQNRDERGTAAWWRLTPR
jgi:hypothetical protein